MPMNTANYLLDNKPDQKVAVISARGEFTYADLKTATASLQARFLALGAQEGDRIGIWAPNSLFWIASYLAALRNGRNCCIICHHPHK